MFAAVPDVGSLPTVLGSTSVIKKELSVNLPPADVFKEHSRISHSKKNMSALWSKRCCLNCVSYCSVFVAMLSQHDTGWTACISASLVTDVLPLQFVRSHLVTFFHIWSRKMRAQPLNDAVLISKAVFRDSSSRAAVEHLQQIIS